ncbi:MAG: mechanosensitive ion channel, partial [Flavobacteriaceae bacterium]|nr:mechanosensitive ion channel [Flavobacteriaceae bacterium]
GLSDTPAKYINMLALLLVLLFILWGVDFIVRKIIVQLVISYAQQTKTHFDDLLVNNKVPRNIAHIIPFLLGIQLIPIVFTDFPETEIFLKKTFQVLAILLTIWIIRSILNTLKSYFKALSRLKDKPIDSYVQVFMIIVWVVGLLSAFAIITSISFIQFAAALGTASAVILLIFKDTILGFVASIQVSVNDMVRIGDWITFDKYGADGDVIEITLATVKVQNFDKTITTIPTYALISDSFKNWRGMTNSDGRRIKRALIIKQNSIKFVSKKEVDALKKIQLLTSYLDNRQKDIDQYNTQHNINKELAINGRNLTNIGIFRKYMQSYVARHTAINTEMTLMVRQLPPTPQGIPLEVYAFSSDKRWGNYEYIMADIFDHLLAAVPYFGLELFELPDNSNFKSKAVQV